MTRPLWTSLTTPCSRCYYILNARLSPCNALIASALRMARAKGMRKDSNQNLVNRGVPVAFTCAGHCVQYKWVNLVAFFFFFVYRVMSIGYCDSSSQWNLCAQCITRRTSKILQANIHARNILLRASPKWERYGGVCVLGGNFLFIVLMWWFLI